MFLSHPRLNLFSIGLILCYLLPPIGILLLCIMGLTTFYKHLKTKRFRFSLITLYVFSIFIANIGASFQSHNSELLLSLLMAVCYFGVYLKFCDNRNTDIKNFNSFLWIVILGGIYNCVIGWILRGKSIPLFIGLLTGTRLFGDFTQKGFMRLIGSAYNPNFTMYLLLMAAAFLLYKMLISLRNRNFKNISWQFILYLILSKGIFDTGSRAAFITLLFVSVVFLFQFNKKLFSVFVLLALLNIKNILNFMPRNSLIDQSYTTREKIWENAIGMWEKHSLFGVTPLGFENEYNRLYPYVHDKTIVHPHNSIIGAFADYGTISGIIFIALILFTIAKIISIYFKRDRNCRVYEFFLLSLPIIFLTSILDEPNFSPQISLITIVLISFWEKYAEDYPLFSFNHAKNISKKLQIPNSQYINHYIHK